MFGNYLRVALRNLMKNPLYSTINVVGLAFGLAACMLIALFVQDELSYDTFWENSDRIYRTGATFTVPGRDPIKIVQAPGPMKAALKQYFPDEIEHSARVFPSRPVFTFEKNGSIEAHEISTQLVDPEFLQMFEIKALVGNMADVTKDNASFAVPVSFAEQHYGRTDILGEVVKISTFGIERDYKIVAVYEDLPSNTVLYLNVIGVIDENDYSRFPWVFGTWFSVNSYLFYSLNEGVAPEAVGDRMAEFIDANVTVPENGPIPPGIPVSEILVMNQQPLTDIQLNPTGLGEMKATGDKNEVIIFASIALAILLVGCINFINLTTAKATQRAREVALRKVHGAGRRQLIAQFLGETLLVALFGLILAITLVEISLGSFSSVLAKDLSIDYGNPATFMIFASLTLFVGVAGGAYPAFIVSGFMPSRVLRSNKSSDASGQGWLRQALVIVQFTVSITLMIATAVVYGQMLYAQNVDAGYEREGRLVIRNTGRQGMDDRIDALRQAMLDVPGVSGASYSGDAPSSSNESNAILWRPGASREERMIIGQRSFDPYFIDVYGLRLLAGRGFDEKRPADAYPTQAQLSAGERNSGVVMINRSAVASFGFQSVEEAVGQTLLRNLDGPDGERDVPFTIIGVVEDHRFQSLRRPVRPEHYYWGQRETSNLSLTYEGDPLAVSAQVRQVWQEIAPDVPFRFDFVGELTQADFEQEANQAMLLLSFSLFAVFIACLGLYGLAVFTAERRTKEIGVRKVMGATIMDIVRLLVWQFSKPVLVANLVAWPLAFVAMSNWLEQFPLRLELWFLLPLSIGASVIALLVAWVTVGGNAAFVARTNPIRALRYE